MVRFAGADPTGFATAVGCEFFRILAHRAFCASAILRREAADMTRFGWVVLLDAEDDPLKDSIPEIIWSNFSSRNCVALRSLRSSCSAFPRLGMITPSGILVPPNCYKTGNNLRRGAQAHMALSRLGFSPDGK